jgi:hypothetical protein
MKVEFSRFFSGFSETTVNFYQTYGVTLQKTMMFNMVMSEAIISINNNSNVTALSGPWLLNNLLPFFLGLQFLCSS